MRIQTWMSAVAGTLMLLATQTPTSAQMPPPNGSAGYYQPQGMAPPPGMPPAQGSPGAWCPPGTPPQQGTPPPGGEVGVASPSQLYPPGTPPSFQPWPAISPFYPGNVAMQQHTNQDGLWFRELFYRRRDFTFSAEALAISFRDSGNATIGSPYARRIHNDNSTTVPLGTLQSFPEFFYGPFVESPNFTPSPTGNFAIDRRILPFPALAVSIFNDTANLELYPIRQASDVGSTPVSPGLKLRWGYINEDNTGFMINGWYGFEQTADFSLGNEFINGVRVNQNITSLLQGQNLSTLNGVVPLYNGEPLSADFGNGSTAKYDILYSMAFSTQAGGSNFSIYQQPLYRKGNVMLRPMWGARYLYINEAFQFRGIDSGFNYSIDYQASTGNTGGGSQQAGQSGTLRPEPNTVVRLYDQYEATLNNRVNSNIAGPEAGFRFDLGNPREGFKIWGESIFGVNVNNEDLHLYGNNIGDPLVDVRIRGFTTPRMLDDANFVSEFNQTKNTTHVSPLFQQSVFMDLNLLEVIPGINSLTLFDDATFRLGYTFLWVGSVARPADSINWQGFPLYPELKNNRQSWWANEFSFAIDWHF